MTDADAYLAARRGFAWRRPERFNFVSDVIERRAAENPDGVALHWTSAAGEESIVSFAGLRDRANAAAAYLASLGIKRGDIVLLVLSREQAWWEIVLGCLQLGAIVSPGTTQLMKKDFAFRISATDAAMLITNAACAPRADEAIVDLHWTGKRVIVDAVRDGWTPYAPDPSRRLRDCADTSSDDEALLYFTSGTTGNPKMTVHSCAYPLGHETTGKFWLRAGPGDLVWNVSDTGWAKGAWSSLFAPWLAGAGIFALHADAVDPARVLGALENYPVTILCAPPTAYRMLVKQPLDGRAFARLRHCVSAGEPLNPEVIEVWRKQTGFQICEGYGQTETVILCGVFDGMTAKPGSMGLPAPGVDLDVIDDDGERLKPDVEGDVAVYLDPPPQGLFLGYRDDAERTKATRRGKWYLTGDRAFRDKDGYFWFVGRGDDVIISAGYRIGPFEVESALIEHPSVAESAVVASPDETRGEVVKAFVVLVKGAAPSDALARELQEHVKRVTAPYKYPRLIEFVDSLPKTISGKIIRKELREREWKGKPAHG
ncbi:MAG: acyl-CoA synthetase [Alphaproteobacteria bacterium RIFCSPHIGHO2_12_FULL_63_12]|nr:MAG: acyl-CoA synthetase [Alphaproteobacteria bacterium RIFCSPHIGHO2_12_FULL_63_12]